MTIPLHRVDPERLRHGQGEALLRRDFSDQAEQDDQLRWWHNRALHNAYGIVAGLTVKLPILDGTRTAKVSPGLAIDMFGRELMLTDRRLLAVPDENEAFLLVLRYDRAAATCEPPPNGWCLDGHVADFGVALDWVPEANFSARDGVALAVNTDKVAFSPNRARPVARPRIGNGVTIVGESAWDPWFEDDRRLGVQIVIDTSAAGFTRPPCYFADVNGSLWSPQIPMLLLIGFSHITDMTKDRFTLRLLIPWLYAQTREGVAALESEEQPGENLLFDAHAHELRRDEARDYVRAPNYRSAVRGVGRAMNLAVTWIGIQRDLDEADLLGAYAGDGGDDEFS